MAPTTICQVTSTWAGSATAETSLTTETLAVCRRDLRKRLLLLMKLTADLEGTDTELLEQMLELEKARTCEEDNEASMVMVSGFKAEQSLCGGRRWVCECWQFKLVHGSFVRLGSRQPHIQSCEGPP